MISGRLPKVKTNAVLPASTMDSDAYATDTHELRMSRRAWWRRHLIMSGMIACTLIGSLFWLVSYMNWLRPSVQDIQPHLERAIAGSFTITLERKNTAQDLASNANAVKESNEVTAAPIMETMTVSSWVPQPRELEVQPSDHPNVNPKEPVRVLVAIIEARVTAYTAYDHAKTKPEWADGIVAWHPNGKKRRVQNHPYGLATDWAQFPGGSCFIRVPGYMSKSFPKFPEAFRVVDDKCGRSRVARRRGEKPVIDVRFVTRYSAISGKQAWGSQHLDVEVLFPAGYEIPNDLRRWVKGLEWRTYLDGDIIEREVLY